MDEEMDETSEFEAGRWRANWIRRHNPGVVARGPMGGVAGQLQSGWAMLRREFNLDQVPEPAPARLTADSRYVLHVNGVELARGPVRGNLRRLHFPETLRRAADLLGNLPAAFNQIYDSSPELRRVAPSCHLVLLSG